ncbi:MAG: hypothetical protein ISR76_08975 [Planctomycetes bacterium]|nr:hypothetical protein [Planctomycetota bacterium]MBL7009117.1 hypothetical protein [Planctomycetota bacterium]
MIPGRSARYAAAGALLLALAAAPLCAQHGPPTEREREAVEVDPDPYVGDDKELKARLGIVSYGPFAWADNHGTSKIEEVLGEVTIRWMETAHFKIGSALGSYKMPVADKKQRAKLRAELAELKELLPEIDLKAKEIDPWLRLHLFAHRLEKQYAEISEIFGVTDSDFPDAPGKLMNFEYRGEGPYFGMPGKFTVLLLQKQSDLGRYTLRFTGQQRDTTTRHMFFKRMESASMFLGVATEAHEGFYGDDTRLHCHLAFNTAHNMIHAYQFYWYALPCWVAEGFAHWYARGVFIENNNWSGIYEQSSGLRSEWNWVPKIYARVRQGVFPPASELCQKTDFSQLRFVEHMMMWSRIEYLLTQEDPARFAVFLDELSGKIPEVQPGLLPTDEQVLAHQEKAFRKAYEMDWDQFDARWEPWILKEFKKRKQ